MYSATLSYDKFLIARKSTRPSKLLKLKRGMSKMAKLFKELTEEVEDGQHIYGSYPKNLYSTLESFTNMCMDINKNDHKEMTKELLDFYLDVNEFVKLSDFYGDKYILYLDKKEDDAKIELFCLDASSFIGRTLKKVKGAVLFSATLQPIEYYIDTLGGNKTDDPHLILPSPFPRENLSLLVAPKVSVKYKNREQSYQEVADYITSFVKNKIGNYFIYSPSYEYMNKLLPHLDLNDYDYFVQDKDMTDEDKESFLLNFHPEPSKTTLGFLVIGGSFGEGVDLVKDRLIGAVIIGIGLPKINFQSDKIAEYYKNRDLPGRDYAYINPGMNKVMQAVGRVIRSETDRGAVLLIDERYLYRQYRDLYKSEWSDYQVALSPEDVSDIISKFFKD